VIVVAEKWVNGLVLPAVSRPTARRTATISCPGELAYKCLRRAKLLWRRGRPGALALVPLCGQFSDRTRSQGSNGKMVRTWIEKSGLSSRSKAHRNAGGPIRATRRGQRSRDPTGVRFAPKATVSDPDATSRDGPTADMRPNAVVDRLAAVCRIRVLRNARKARFNWRASARRESRC
jgi:hypothetical protein